METQVVKDERTAQDFNWLRDMSVHLEADVNGNIDVEISGTNDNDKLKTVRYCIALLTSTMYAKAPMDIMHEYTDYFQQGVLDGIKFAGEERKRKEQEAKKRKAAFVANEMMKHADGKPAIDSIINQEVVSS